MVSCLDEDIQTPTRRRSCRSLTANVNCIWIGRGTADAANGTAIMANTVNLNVVRKARARAADKAKAEANRALHGLTKAQRAIAWSEQERLSRLLDQARRED